MHVKDRTIHKFQAFGNFGKNNGVAYCFVVFVEEGPIPPIRGLKDHFPENGFYLDGL
jgi:hypothetical protein|tara:strand:- start:817 stop:987 length:171 start_codon:yes stop_codon:yes gene_type:complete